MLFKMKTKIFQTFQNLLAQICSIAKSHLAALKVQCDPVIKLAHKPTKNYAAQDQGQQKFNKLHYLFPIFVLLYVNLYGFFYLHYESTGHFLRWSDLANSPYIFIHQVIPRPIWAQYDVMTAFAITGVFLVFCAFLYEPTADEQFLVFLWNRSTAKVKNSKS